MSDSDPYKTPVAPVEENTDQVELAAQAEYAHLKGLGGWLILLGIGVVLSPIRLLVTYVPIYNTIFTNGSWEALTTPGTEAYTPYYGALLIGELIMNTFIVLVSMYMVYLFFTKHYLFPRVYIGIMILALILIPLDAVFVKLIFPDEPMFDPDTLKEFIRTIVGSLVWIPYLLVSRRVKVTFVERKPGA